MRCCPFPLKAIAVYSLIHLVCITPGFASILPDTNTAISDTTSQGYGFIHFEIEPDTLYLYLNRDYRNRIAITDGMKLKTPAGANRLYIFGSEIPDRRELISLREGETRLLRLNQRFFTHDMSNPMYAAYRWDANLMLFSEEDTEISVVHTNYQSYGKLKAKLPAGSHRVQYKSATGRVTERFIEVNSYELITDERYFRPRKNIAVMAGIVPGGSQLYKRQPARAALAFGLVGVSTGLAIHYNQQVGADGRRFETALGRYQRAVSPEDALRFGNELDQLAPRIDVHRRNRAIFGAAALVLYAAHIFDTLREPDSGFAQRRTFNPYRDFSFDMQHDSITAHIQFRF